MRARVSATIAVICFAILSPIHYPAAEAALAGTGIPTNSLQLYYDMANANSYIGGTGIRDLSGNGYDGTVIGSPTYSHTSSGGLLTFSSGGTGSGTDGLQHINAGTTFNPNFTNGITISVYGSLGTVADTYERFVDFGNGSSAENIIFGRDGTSSNVYYESYNGAGSRGRCTSSGGVTTGVQLWTVVVSSTLCKVYAGNNTTAVGGNAVDLRPTSTASARTKNYIGRSNWGDSYLGGSIYRIAIWNRAINVDTELATIYNSMVDTSWISVSGTGTYSVNENTTAVATLTSSPNEVATYLEDSTRGDFNKFSISSSGVLTLDSAQNFEAITPNTTFYFYLYITDANGNSQIQVLTINIVDVIESTGLSTPTLSATPFKGLSVTITVTPSGDGTSIPGRVTYLLAGKRIPACYKKIYSGTGNSTCNFEPSIQGSREISVTFTPTNTNFTAVTSKKNFFIYKRTTLR